MKMSRWMCGLAGVVVLAAVLGCGKKEGDSAALPKVEGLNPADLGRDVPVSAQPALPPRDPAQVAAEVDGEKLTEGEISAQIERWMTSMGGRVPPEQLPQMVEQARRQLAEQFVIKTLLTRAAQEASIAVADGDVDEALAEIKERLPEGMTLDEVLTREGMTPADLRSNLVTEIRIKKLVEGRTGMGEPTEAEIAAFYETQKESFQKPEMAHARHILIKNELNDDEAARAANKAKAEAIREKLAGGANFAELAKTESACPSSARGGDLGSFPRGQMVPAFEEAAFSQATNVIGPVVETVFGYHIIQVLDREAATSQSLDEVREKIVAFLKRQKNQDGFWKLIEELKAKSKITLAEDLRTAGGPMPMPGRRPTPPAPPAPAPETAPVPEVPAPEAAPAVDAAPAPVPGA